MNVTLNLHPLPRSRTILFALSHPGFLRNFEDVIALLCSEGTHVHVHFSKRHESIELSDYEFVRNASSNPTFSWGEDTKPSDRRLVGRIRVLRDAIFYSQPDFRDATHLRRRFSEHQKTGLFKPATVRGLLYVCDRAPWLLKRVVDHALRWADGWLPPAKHATALLDAVEPDLVVVSPLVNFSSREVDVVKAARKRKVPTVLAVASWDNLTNKGVIKCQPDFVAVWNRHMKREAVSLHRVPANRIWVTGAPLFDRWFERKPTRDRETFLRDVGLDPGRPLILYCCSSQSIAGASEDKIVERWLGEIRASSHPVLASANVLVRPHPMESLRWREPQDEQRPEDIWRNARVWPLTPKHPTSEAGRAEFFDSLCHADAVVGLNTSVMIEATILGKPVLTFLGHAATETQTANLHFRYLVERGGVQGATSLSAHARQLAEALADPAKARGRRDRFVIDFIRPRGLHAEASAALAQRLGALVRSREAPLGAGDRHTLNGPGHAALDHFGKVNSQSRVRELQLAQIFQGIEHQQVETGAIDPDTKHPNHVDMLYVCAIARHIGARRIFEFGTYLGRTTYHLARAGNQPTVFTLDLDPALPKAEDMKLGRAVRSVLEQNLQGHFFRHSSVAGRVVQLHGDSRTFDFSPYHGTIDFVFIDAGHTYEFVANDTAHALKMLRPSGVIVWHDYASKSPGVVSLAQEFSQKRPLFWVASTSLLVFVDGVDAMAHSPAVPKYARALLKA